MPFSDEEVHKAWVYAMTSRPKDNFVGVVTDKNLLLTIADEAAAEYRPGFLLPALVGRKCRKHLRQRFEREERTYEAYLCGIMKLFSLHAAAKTARRAAKRAAKKTKRVRGERYDRLPSGQFLLPLPRPRGATKRRSTK